MPNGSLKSHFIKEKSNKPDSKWNWTKKYISLLGISDAMRYLHEHGIVHRDLKPQNILIDENYYPHICDFGLSRCFPEIFSNSIKLTMTGGIGTPIYMAPELWEDCKSQYSPSIDFYAFGILAYEVITGKEPFSELGNITIFELAKKVIQGYRPQFTDDIPEKMIYLISKCWSQNIKERPSFEEIFKQLSNDFSYFDENVDENEVINYIKYLKNEKVEEKKEENHLQARVNDLEKENKKLKTELNQLKIKNEKDDEKNTENYLQVHINDLEEENKKLKTELNQLKNKIENPITSSYMIESSFIQGIDAIHGNKLERSNRHAIRYFKQASENGNGYASYFIGILYENGEICEKDFQKAIEYYEKASEQGVSYGINRIGLCYACGFGIDANYSKSIEYYQRGIELGNPFSIINLASRYKERYNYSMSMKYYQKAADLKIPYGFFEIGYSYE